VRKRLLILGGNRYNTPAIRAARQAGFVTLVADRNPDAPGLAAADVGLPVDIVDVDALVEALRHCGSVDGVVSMAEAGVRPAADVSRRLDLPSITPQAAAAATSKAAMRQAWRALGRWSLDFEVVRSEAEACAAIERLGGLPMIFKPDRSFGGSRGVRRVESPDEIAGAMAFARAGGLPDTVVLIEPLLIGTEYSTEVLIWQGRTSLLCIGQKVKSPPPYRVDLSVQYPAAFPTGQREEIASMCHDAVRTLGLEQGGAHIEFAMVDGGPVLLELGARCGGGHTPQIAHHVSGVDEFVETCRMACGLAPSRLEPIHERGADYRFVIFPPGALADVDIPAHVQSHPQILDVGVTVQPGEAIRPLRTTADRAGFVVTCTQDKSSAVALADWACGQIRATYEDGATSFARSLAEMETRDA